MVLRPSRQHTSTQKALFAVLAISATFFTLVAIEPLGVDNAVLHSIGKDWVLYGRIPYLGSWDNNFPGIMMVHALEILLFGTSAIAFRLFDIAIQLAFVAFLYRFLLRWLPVRTAALAGVLYSLYYVAGGTYLYGQQDGYAMMAILVGSSLVIDRESVGFPRLLASALMVGLSFLMRPTFLLYPGLLSLYLAVDSNARFGTRRLPRSIGYFLLCLLPMIALLTYYASLPGGLDAFYTSTIRFNLDVYTKLKGGSLWIELARTGLLIPFAIFSITPVARRSQGIRLSRRNSLYYFALIGSGLFVVVLMAKFWRYQFAPFFIALIPLSAVGIESFVQMLAQPIRRHYATILSVFFCTLFWYNPATPVTFLGAVFNHRDPFVAVEDVRRTNPDAPAPAERAMLQYLQEPTRRSATVEVCGFDPYLRLDLQRPCVGPYVTFHALGFRTDASNSGPGQYTPYQLAWQAQYARTLTTNPPLLLVLGRHQKFWYLKDVLDDVFRKSSSLNSVLGSYRLDTTIAGYDVYVKQ